LRTSIDLYEVWNKPEKAKEWRVKLTQIEDIMKSDRTIEKSPLLEVELPIETKGHQKEGL